LKIEAPLDKPNEIQMTINTIGIVFPIEPNAFALTKLPTIIESIIL